MIDHRVTPLAEALPDWALTPVARDARLHVATDTLAALPPDWCGHGAFMDTAALRAEIARLRPIEEAARDVDGMWEAEDDEVIRWLPEAGEALNDLRAALEADPQGIAKRRQSWASAGGRR